MKGREAKGKGEKKRYTHLNADFQRKPRIDKKGFLSDLCKETEENNRLTDFIFLGQKITVDGDCSHEIKTLAPWKKGYNKSRQDY